MKRILSLLLVLVLTVTLFPVRVQAKTGGKLVALTFDDGPSSKYTAELLDGLKERGVKVTFFMLGEMAKSNPKLVKRAYEEGHEIACHSWDHPDLTGCKESEVKRQMSDTFLELDKACGTGADYLVRPPYGSTNEKVRNAIDAPLIYWSVDSRDWSLLNTEKVRKKIVDECYDGCIILCHDIHKTTIPAALGAIDDLLDLGYEFVTVSELYRRRGRTLEDHKLHYSSKKNGVDYGPIPAPSISVSGDPKGVNTVTITCSDKNVPLYYTLDGSYPNQTATAYTGPFTVPYGTTVTAVAAYNLNGSRSALTTKKADAIQIVAPSITLDSSGRVVMTTPTADAQIRYTVDGTKPGSSSTRYSGTEFLAGGCVLRAVTIHDKGSSAESSAYLSAEGMLYYDMTGKDWFYDAMHWAHMEGILNGTAPYTMSPSGAVTRGMLVTLLYRFSGHSLESGWERTNRFEDVKQSYYYAEAIEWASRNHIVDGYSELAFGPDDAVTRQQMCKIVASYLNWLGMPLEDGVSCEGRFADYDQIADWALQSVEGMVSAGLIQGDGTNLNPNDGANRAQVCVLLQRLARYVENYQPQEPDPSEPAPSEPQPSEPQPSEPEPSEPGHVHDWKLNKALSGSDTEGDVSIRVGEHFFLRIICKGEGCKETAQVVWVPSTEGVVTIEGDRITGAMAGWNTWLSAEWDGETYKCIVRVRKQTNDVTEPTMPV